MMRRPLSNFAAAGLYFQKATPAHSSPLPSHNFAVFASMESPHDAASHSDQYDVSNVPRHQPTAPASLLSQVFVVVAVMATHDKPSVSDEVTIVGASKSSMASHHLSLEFYCEKLAKVDALNEDFTCSLMTFARPTLHVPSCHYYVR